MGPYTDVRPPGYPPWKTSTFALGTGVSASRTRPLIDEIGPVCAIGGGIAVPGGGGGDEHLSASGGTVGVGEAAEAVGVDVGVAVGAGVGIGFELARPSGAEAGVALGAAGGDDEQAAARSTAHMTSTPIRVCSCAMCRCYAAIGVEPLSYLGCTTSGTQR